MKVADSHTAPTTAGLADSTHGIVLAALESSGFEAGRLGEEHAAVQRMLRTLMTVAGLGALILTLTMFG